MSEETKTAEETTILDIAIQEIERQKFSLIENKTPATKVGLTDALSVLKFLKDEHYIKCECGHEVEHKFSHTNEDGQVTCYTCVNAELKKQNELLEKEITKHKFAAEILIDSPEDGDLLNKILNLEIMSEAKDMALDELKNRLSEAESAIEGSDIKIYDLKKQNAELVDALKESLIDQNARYNILMIKALNSNEQNPEKTMYGEEAAIVLKRMKATQKIVRKYTSRN